MTPTRLQLQLPNLRLSALEYGGDRHGADHPPVLLLHGQADLAWAMHPVALELAARHRVISLDLRGHGESDQPGSYGLLQFIGDLAAVVELLALERPVVVGHSLGGQIAAQYCGLFPEVPSALVVAEGIGPPARVGTGDAADRLARARNLVELAALPMRLRPMADEEEAATRLAAAHPGLDAERAAFLAHVGTRPAPDGGVIWRFDPFTRHWLLTHDQDRAEERWANVRCPVLVVTGGQAWERWWKHQSPGAKLEGWRGHDPGEVARRVACFGDVEHRELPDAGHMLPYDAPDALAALIREFLERRLPAKNAE
ncbi:MAG: alpha/beta fold hydrolase [Acidimicrobiia bacterium]